MVLRSVLITSLVTVVSPWKMRPLPPRPDSSLHLPSVSRPLPLPPQPAPTAAQCQGPVPGPQGPAAAARPHTEPKVLDGLHPVSCRLLALVRLVGTSCAFPVASSRPIQLKPPSAGPSPGPPRLGPLPPAPHRFPLGARHSPAPGTRTSSPRPAAPRPPRTPWALRSCPGGAGWSDEGMGT